MIDLLKQENLLISFVRNMPVAVAMFDRDMRYIIASKTWLENEGLEHLNVIGQSHYKLNPAIPEKWRKTHHQCLQGEFLSKEEDHYIKTDGSVEWVRWKCHPWFNADDEVGGVMLFSESINQKIELAREKDRLARMVRQAPMFIFILNRNCELMYMNQVAEGFQMEDLIGQSIMNFVSPEYAQPKKERIQCAFDTEEVQHGEVQIYMPDGTTRWFESIYSPYYEQGKVVGVLCYSTDIEFRKEIEAQKRAFSLELEQKNEELEQYVHITSHDLKEPVRMIASYLQLLKLQNPDLNKESKEHIEFAIEGAKRIQRLSASLMRYTRLGNEGISFEEFSLQTALDAVIMNLKTLIEEKKAEIASFNLPDIRGENEQITLLLQNLVENGLKFNKSQNPRVEVSCRISKGKYEIEVKDNGIGFDEKYSEKVFQAFERLNSRVHFDGAGMGLAICKRIVDNHKGKVGVTSTPGKGSTFRITIPS